ncbi:MAG TPA: tetratricopeptide repeat protein, partial [Nitrospirota bacterium]|nr:tetratricopeptide repeat protein [Nitrospirota bacterium]
SAAPGPEPRSKAAAASPPGSSPVQEQEQAEEVLVVEPLEAEPVGALQEPAAEGFDFLSEGKMDAGEGTIPGLEVSVPGGFFEDAPLLAPEQEGPAEAQGESGVERGEPGLPAFPEEEAPPAAIKKSDDDFTTDTLAELYISQGFYEKAIDIYDRMLMENPGHQGLRDKLARLHVLAEEAGGGRAGSEKSEEESAPALEPGNAPDLAGITGTGGAEDMIFVPPAAGKPEETLPVDTAFDIGEPFGQAPLTGGELEAKEYVLPPQEEQEEPPPFSGGFDLSEKEFPPSREEDENEADRVLPPAGGRPSPVRSRAEPVEYRPAVEYTPARPEKAPVAPSSGEPATRTVKDARKETISRLELWLKTIAKEK